MYEWKEFCVVLQYSKVVQSFSHLESYEDNSIDDLGMEELEFVLNNINSRTAAGIDGIAMDCCGYWTYLICVDIIPAGMSDSGGSDKI